MPDAKTATNEPQGEWTAAEAALIARAKSLAPVVGERAGKAEHLRRIPDETDADFRAAGFYRIMQPARYGGLESRYGLHTMLGAEVARGCGSSGWAISITACHSWIFGMFPQEAQDEFWGPDPERAVASSFLPVGPQVTPEQGGIRLSGRWRFSSNVDHCQGAILIAMVPQPSGPPKQHFVFLPREQYAIEDTWKVVGLAATGSNDVVVKDAFVPEHRMLDIMLTRDGRAPGAAANTNYLFGLPLFAPFAHSLIGAALGAAQGALDQIISDLSSKTSVGNVKLADQQTIQTRIAEATVEIEAARALLQADRGRINDMGRLRLLPDDEQRVRYRLNVSYAAKLCVQAVERLMPIVGGRGLELRDPFQRAWRDVHAVAQHIALVFDLNALNYGAVRLGGKAGDPENLKPMPIATPMNPGMQAWSDTVPLALSLARVGLTYGTGKNERVVLKEISFDVAARSFVSVVGPAGCGKSSLLRMIAGLLPPTVGAIKSFGAPVTKPSRQRAIVFQDYDKALLPWRKVWRNVALSFEAQGLSKPQQRDRAYALLKQMRLDKMGELYPSQLDGGMQQRVQIARCLAQEPRLLLMDEPFGALDALTRQILQDEVAQLVAERGLTVIFVTHDIDEAIYLGDGVIVLHNNPGTIAQMFPVVLARPRDQLATRASSEFLGHRHRLLHLLQGRAR